MYIVDDSARASPSKSLADGCHRAAGVGTNSYWPPKSTAGWATGSMNPVDYQQIEEVAKQLYIRALKILPPDVRETLKAAYAREANSTARIIFETILKNVYIRFIYKFFYIKNSINILKMA